MIISALLLFFGVSISILTAGILLSSNNDFYFGDDSIAPIAKWEMISSLMSPRFIASQGCTGASSKGMVKTPKPA